MNTTLEYTWEDFKFSPSRHDGMSEEVERYLRYEGCKFIDDFGKRDPLSMKGKDRSLACSIFHQFYLRASFKTFRRSEIGVACLLLAAKMNNNFEPKLGIENLASVAMKYFGNNYSECRPSLSNLTAKCEIAELKGKEKKQLKITSRENELDARFFWAKRIRDNELSILHRLNGQIRCLLIPKSVAPKISRQILRFKVKREMEIKCKDRNGSIRLTKTMSDEMTIIEAKNITVSYCLTFALYAMRSIVCIMYPPPWVAAACYFLFVKYYNRVFKNRKEKQLRLVSNFWQNSMFAPAVGWNSKMVEKNGTIVNNLNGNSDSSNRNRDSNTLSFNLLQYLSDEILAVCDNPAILCVLHCKRQYVNKPSELSKHCQQSHDFQVLSKMHEIGTKKIETLNNYTQCYLKDCFYINNNNNNNNNSNGVSKTKTTHLKNITLDLRKNAYKYKLLFNRYKKNCDRARYDYWQRHKMCNCGMYRGPAGTSGAMATVLINSDLQERNKYVSRMYYEKKDNVESIYSNDSFMTNKNKNNNSDNTRVKKNSNSNENSDNRCRSNSNDNKNRQSSSSSRSRSGNSYSGRKRGRKEIDQLSRHSNESLRSTAKICAALRLREPMSEQEVFYTMGWPKTKKMKLAPICVSIPDEYQRSFDLTQCDSLMENLFSCSVIEQHVTKEFVFQDDEKKNGNGYFCQSVYLDGIEKYENRVEMINKKENENSNEKFNGYLIECLDSEMDICKIHEIFSHFGELASIMTNVEKNTCVILYKSLVNCQLIFWYFSNVYIFNNFKFNIRGLTMNDELRMKGEDRLGQEEDISNMNRKRRDESITAFMNDSSYATEHSNLNKHGSVELSLGSRESGRTPNRTPLVAPQSFQTKSLSHRQHRNRANTSVTSAIFS